MKEYEISVSDKVIGKVNIYKENINKELNSSLIESNKGMSFKKIDEKDYQTYELEYTVNNIDDLFDIVSKYIYDKTKVFDMIEDIKKYNNIKSIKKNTNIKIIVPEIYLSKLNKSKEDINLNSMFLSKIHFIKSVMSTLNNIELIDKLNNIIKDYNTYINSSEYEFYDFDEIKNNINAFLKRLDEIINYIESKSNFMYGKNYIIPIKINMVKNDI